MINLSVIIVSFNTKKITDQCLHFLKKNLSRSNLFWEIVIVDNKSTDGSVELLRRISQLDSRIKLIENNKNLGFSKANNQAIKEAKGKYFLFLNSDILINNLNFEEILDFMDKDEKIGGLTVKVILENNQLDWASHRGFPTLWNSFCYFLKLEEIFGKFFIFNKIFAGYHLKDKNLNKIHEIDSPSGAFFLTRGKIIKDLGGFDEDFFMYGEDLDLAYRIKELGYKIIYYPKYQVTHLKYASGLKKNNQSLQRKVKKHFFEAMKIFYKKHYQKKYPWIINQIIYFVIDWKIKNLK